MTNYVNYLTRSVFFPVAYLRKEVSQPPSLRKIYLYQDFSELVFLTYLKNAFKPIQNFAKYTRRLAKAIV